MTLQEFIAEIRARRMVVPSSKIVGDSFGTVMEPLTLDDPEAVTAEAFSHGVFNPDVVSWDDALDMVVAGISQ